MAGPWLQSRSEDTDGWEEVVDMDSTERSQKSFIGFTSVEKADEELAMDERRLWIVVECTILLQTE